MDTGVYLVQENEIQDWNSARGIYDRNINGEHDGINRNGDIEYQNRMRRQQRRRMLKRKKKLARKRRRRKAIRILLLCIGVYILLRIVGSVIGGIFADGFSGLGKKATVVPDSKYSSNTPQILDEEQIRQRLQGLAQEYPDFEDIYENMDAYPEKLLSALCNNPEMIDFVKGYLEADHSEKGWITKIELSQRFPLLMQWDKRWGYIAYGDNIIGLSGCAPTCLSMVIVGLTGDESATPDAVADYATRNGYYVEGTGTAWSLMTDVSGYGINGREMSLDKSIVYQELEAGHPIICSMRPGDFTSIGHFIVLTQVEDDRIRVNDPNSLTRSRQLWDYDTLESQICNLWVFEKE